MCSYDFGVGLLAGCIAGAFPAVAQFQQLHPDHLTSEFHSEGRFNLLTQQRTVPDSLLGKFSLHKTFDFTRDAWFGSRRFAVGEPGYPKRLKPV